MNNLSGILRALLRTEKGTLQAPMNKYFFSVSTKANKIQIKQAVESAYHVKVKGVRTAVMPGKLKRVRVQTGRTPEWKRAIVTLKPGQQISVS